MILHRLEGAQCWWYSIFDGRETPGLQYLLVGYGTFQSNAISLKDLTTSPFLFIASSDFWLVQVPGSSIKMTVQEQLMLMKLLLEKIWGEILLVWREQHVESWINSHKLFLGREGSKKRCATTHENQNWCVGWYISPGGQNNWNGTGLSTFPTFLYEVDVMKRKGLEKFYLHPLIDCEWNERIWLKTAFPDNVYPLNKFINICELQAFRDFTREWEIEGGKIQSIIFCPLMRTLTTESHGIVIKLAEREFYVKCKSTIGDVNL